MSGTREDREEALRRFIRRSDRNDPAHFAGRTEEIEAVENALQGVSEGASGLTKVITGAPGSGKTALLNALRRKHEAAGGATASILPQDFQRPEDVTATILAQIDLEAARRAGVNTDAGETWAVGMSAGLLNAEWSRNISPRPPTSLAGVLSKLPQPPDKPILLLVDEAQNIAGDLPDGKSSLLAEAHTREMNLLLVLGGLSNTPTTLSRLGVSRLARGSERTLQPLSDEEALEAAGLFFDQHFPDAPTELRKNLSQEVVKESRGWPQHLTNALCAAAEVALGKPNHTLKAADIPAVVHRSLAYRRDYYESRTQDLRAEFLSELLCARSKDGTWREHPLYKAVEEAQRKTLGELSQKAIEGRVEEILRQGIIQRAARHRYSSPIPSLVKYMEARCRAEGLPVSLRGNTR